MSNRLDIQATHCLRLDSSLEHDLKSAMTSQKPRKSKQKSLLSWVGPLDNKANVEDEIAEKSCDAECQRGAQRTAWVMLLLSLLKQLVLYLEVDEISQEIVSF